MTLFPQHYRNTLYYIPPIPSSPESLRIEFRREMSKRAKSPTLELKLNLSPPRAANSSLVSTCSWDEGSSCVTSDEADEEGTRAMILVGCLRCLMYVMFSQVDPNPKCPKCKSTVLLHFLNNDEKAKKSKGTS